jgi:L-fuconolactonase
MIIDAHQHFWQLDKPFKYDWLYAPDKKAICRSYLPADLLTNMQRVGVTHSVFVQTQHDVEENRWVLRLAEENPFILGVVGWVDLASPRVEEQLEEFIDHPKFVGVRHVVQDEPDDDWIVREDVLRGLKVLEKHEVPYDLLFFTKHLRHAPTVARALPDLPLVIDHLSKPEIKAKRIDEWRKDLRAAAALPNMHCKLSGMVTEADWGKWRPADLKPYVQEALDAFGPSRLMFGSDWPVCELAGSYTHVFHGLIAALGPISDSDLVQILSGTARRFYGLR